jgi:hypothetical protein
MAKTEVEAVKLSAREYQLCRNHDCPVVYYAGEVQLEKTDLRVPVNFKERNYEGPVCYCFNHTVTDVRAEIQTKGHSTAQRMITQEVKAGRCACEVKNPAGACCLGDITRAVQAVMAQVRDRRAALQSIGGKAVPKWNAQALLKLSKLFINREFQRNLAQTSHDFL